MFFSPPKQKNGILQVDEDFARVVGITTFHSEANAVDTKSTSTAERIKLVLSYRMSQITAIEENCYEVVVTVKTANKIRPVIIASRHAGVVDSNEVVSRILTHKSKIENLELSENILAQVSSDISSKISNELITAVKRGDFDMEKLGFKKSKIVLKQVKEIREKNLEQNVLRPRVGSTRQDNEFGARVVTESGKRTTDEKKLFRSMVHMGITPTSALDYRERGISSFESSSGLSKKKKRAEFAGNPAVKLLNFALFERAQNKKSLSEMSETAYMPVLESVVDTSIKIDVPIDLPTSVLNSSENILVKFELIKSQKDTAGRTITSVYDSTQRSLDVNELYATANVPLSAPKVSHTVKEGKVCFAIEQADDIADGVFVYKRALYDYDEHTKYSQIDEIEVSKKTGVQHSRYTLAGMENCVYRFIPRCKNNRGKISCHFTDVLVKQNAPVKKRVTLVPRIVDGGIKVTVYSNDPLVKSARILIRDATARQKDLYPTDNTVYFSALVDRQEIFLRNLTQYHIYELGANLVLDTGEEFTSTNVAYIEYLPYVAGGLNVTLTEQTTATTGASYTDLSLAIVATIQRDQIGQISNLLGQLSGEYDTKALLSRYAEFDKLIAFEVTRYDLTTGEVSNLGIIENSSVFSDTTQSRKFQALPMMDGHRYEFIFHVLLREPESIISDSKEMRDEETKKKYKIDPRKNRHPFTLSRGISLSKKAIDKDPKHDMLYGKLGLNYSYSFNVDIGYPEITNFAAVKRSGKVYISWDTVGDTSVIDHFLLFIEHDTVRTQVGKSHSLVNHLEYEHVLTPSDVGSAVFLVIPVYYDFSMGSSIYSEEILIEQTDIA